MMILVQRLRSPGYVTKCIHKLMFTRTQSSESELRNIFELYQKNSHWMGVYKRNPVIPHKIKMDELQEMYTNEFKRKAPIDIEEYIANNRTEWTPMSKRVGAVGIKIGSTVLWDKEGFRHHCTVVQIQDCVVLESQVSYKHGGRDNATQVIVGACDVTDDEHFTPLSKERMEWFHRRGFEPKRYWCAFPVTTNALLLPGTKITAPHFVPGQIVRVRSRTIYQGMQGVMKRWGMKGQPKTHGQTKTHRKMGATGGGQDPGRIFPGKRMAGHVGGKQRTTKGLKLFRINTKYNLLWIKGTIPGEVGSFVKIFDANRKIHLKKKFPPDVTPPFPTYYHDDDTAELEEDLFADFVARPTDPPLEFPPYEI